MLNIYIDESSQTGHRYLVLGGICVSNDDCHLVDEAFGRARIPELPAGELKWTKVSRSKLPAYMRVVDAFFDGIGGGKVFDFHSLVVDTHARNEALFNEGSREIGFNKEIYQLSMKFIRLYPGNLYHIYPDQRTTSSKTEELRLILNRGAAKNYRRVEWPVRRLHFRDSGIETCLQIVDILTGCIAFLNNGHHLAENASAAKCELACHIMSRARINNPAVDTAMGGRFTIWHRRLRRRV